MPKRSHDPSTTSPSEITPDTNGVDPATAGVGQDVIPFGAAVRALAADLRRARRTDRRHAAGAGR
jgi:hypothetical protein